LPAFVWMILLPLAASPLIYLSGHLGKRRRARSVAAIVALIALLAAWVPFVLAARTLHITGPVSFEIGAVSLSLDGIGLLLAAVALSLGTLVVIFSGPYLSAEMGQEKFYAMLAVMVGAIIGLGCAADLFNLWVWFETMAISSYMLVAFYHEHPPSLEAGIKYLVQSAVGSVLVLLGIGLVFSQTGSLDLTEIQASTLPQSVVLAAGALFAVGFGVKAALVPLHTWLPDAHSQAPSGISAMLSGVVIEAGLIALLRSLSVLSPTTSRWGAVLLGFGALNMLVGNLMALRQTQVKRLLAYSSISQVGYILVGIGIALYADKVNGAQGGFFHLFNHGMMKGMAFLAAGALLYTLHIAAGEHKPLSVNDLSGAAHRYPLAAFALGVAVLGLGGIPPLSGFMSKWQILVAGLETRSPWVDTAVVFAALNSVLSLAYYVPLVNTLYRKEQSEAVKSGRPFPLLMAIPLLLLIAAIVIVGVWPSLMNWLTEPAGASLLSAFGL